MQALKFALGAVSVLALISIVLGAVWQQFETLRDQDRAPPPGRLVDVGGRRLHLYCEGAGEGPTVILLAGGGIPAVASYALQDSIAGFARVCSYDRAGLGWSEPATNALGLVAQAEDLERLLAAEGIDGPLVLAPESFGALIALTFAERNPARIAGIAFIDGSEPGTWFATIARQPRWRSRLQELGMHLGWRTGAVRLLLPRLEPAWVEALSHTRRAQFRAVFSRPNSGWGDALDAFEQTPPADRPRSGPGALGSIPLLVLSHGRGSALVSDGFEAVWPEAQAALGRLSTGRSTMIELADASHTMAQDQSAEVARLIRQAFFSAPP